MTDTVGNTVGAAGKGVGDTLGGVTSGVGNTVKAGGDKVKGATGTSAGDENKQTAQNPLGLSGIVPWNAHRAFTMGPSRCTNIIAT